MSCEATRTETIAVDADNAASMITALLNNLEWKPHRAHLETSRDTFADLAKRLRALSPSPQGGRLSESERRTVEWYRTHARCGASVSSRGTHALLAIIDRLSATPPQESDAVRKALGFSLTDFVRESNRIEGIHREPTADEVAVTERFLDLTDLQIEHLEQLVSVYAPGNRLRDKPGLNVRVGNYIAPAGGPEIRTALLRLLHMAKDNNTHPWLVHMEYEKLHPFTDGNGRSGRALWLWMMAEAPLGFLHHFYYQTLQNDPARSLPQASGGREGWKLVPVEPTDKELHHFGYAPGDYESKCFSCGAAFRALEKRATSCRPCAVRRYKSLINALAAAPLPPPPAGEREK